MVRKPGGRSVQAPVPARLIEGGLPTEERPSPRCWYRSSPTIFRSTDRPRSMPVRALPSTIQPWPTGAGARPSCCSRCTSGCSTSLKASPKLFADETTAPVLDPGRGRTKTGQLFAYARRSAVGAPIRPAWSMSMHRIARPNGRSRISPASRASCRLTATAATRCWPGKATCDWPSAGATWADTSTPGPRADRCRGVLTRTAARSTS